jgi:ABC-type phosphate/phosphonate transport system substrate-binding protein
MAEGFHLLFRFLLFFLLCCIQICSATGRTAQKEEVNIGVYTFRAKGETLKSFQPLADRLGRDIPSHHFNIIPLSIKELNKEIADEKLNFIITNVANYIVISEFHPASNLAGFVAKAKDGQPVYTMGGVIMTRADRTDINTLDDLKHKKIVAVGKQVIGAYLTQAEVLYDKGIDLQKDAKVTFRDVVQDELVLDVIQGRQDVAFIRSGILEMMVTDGVIKSTDFKIINQKSIEGFPYTVSTPLYPEWVFASVNSDKDLSKKVVISLLGIQQNDAELVAGGYYGWDTPPSLERTKNMMKKLKVHPFDTQVQFDIADVLKKYFWENMAAACLIFLLLAFCDKT